MILDAGILQIMRPAGASGGGNMFAGEHIQIWRGWYGELRIGFARYFTARQANTQVDKLVRILRPPVELTGEDMCVVGGHWYRIAQVQENRDDGSGELVLDLTLERMGDKYGDHTGT